MSWRPLNCSQLMPSIVVKNANHSVDFYTKGFGFILHDNPSIDENGAIQHAMLQLGECTIMIFPENSHDMPYTSPKTSRHPSPIGLYVYVPDVDSLYQQAVVAGAKTLEAPMDSFWGDRFCKVADPDGYEWMFATHNAERHRQHAEQQ